VTGQNFSQPASRLSSKPTPLRKDKLDSDTKGRFVGLVGLCLFSVWIVVHLSSNFYLSLASRHWPTTYARVTSSAVYTHGAGAGMSWAPVVQYEYEAAGAEHRSSNIRFLLGTFYNADAAAEVVASYPVGRQVSVAYDPQDPNRSVLEPGVPQGMWTQAIIPLFFFGLCGYIFYEILHPERRMLLATYLLGNRGEDESQSDDEPETA
jgi:hypothetical protein